MVLRARREFSDNKVLYLVESITYRNFKSLIQGGDTDCENRSLTGFHNPETTAADEEDAIKERCK